MVDGRMRYEIEHRTRYVYPEQVRGCVLTLCLEPVPTDGQRLVEFEIETRPAASLSPEQDGFGNRRHVLNVHRRHPELTIISRLEVERDPGPPLQAVGGWKEIRSLREAPEHWHLLRPSRLARSSHALEDFARRHDLHPGDDPMASLVGLSDRLHHSFAYQPGSTSADSPIEHVLKSGRGVCQDYAHVMIAIARSWGVPSRYVSGYLHTTGVPGEQTVASGSHAWVECRLPGAGWVGFDPTNATFSDERHIRVAAGRDYADVSPISGVFQGTGDAKIEVDVIVKAVDPRELEEKVSGRNRRQRG